MACSGSDVVYQGLSDHHLWWYKVVLQGWLVSMLSLVDVSAAQILTEAVAQNRSPNVSHDPLQHFCPLLLNSLRAYLSEHVFLPHCETQGAWNIRAPSTTTPARPDTLHRVSPILRCPTLHSLHRSSAAEGRQTAGRFCTPALFKGLCVFSCRTESNTQDHWRGTWRGRTSGAHPHPETSDDL